MNIRDRDEQQKNSVPNATREEFMNIQVGDIIKLKKQHPCGSREWEVLRVGADFRLKCLGCGHQIMVPRRLVEKNVREIREKA